MKSSVWKIIALVLIVGIGFYFSQNTREVQPKNENETVTSNVATTNIPTITEKKQTAEVTTISSTSVFVPYWTLDEGVSQEKADKLFYFGIAADTNGINTEDPGYKNLSTFVEVSGSKQKYLTIRMLDTESNIEILENTQLQQKIIQESIAVATRNGFDGVVLDLEISVLPFVNVEQNITTFIQRFGKEVKNNDMKYAVAIYGDVFYRARPFNVKEIASSADEIVIMAYDFSKSYGEPGPNFPFTGKETYGYDFQTMITDYKKIVPADKLTVTFGMFGYDWVLGPEGKPLKGAVSLTVHQAKARYLNGCTFAQCTVKRNVFTKETNVSFKDGAGNQHEVWFEDEQSVEKKIEFLQQQGISHISYWAYGYY